MKNTVERSIVRVIVATGISSVVTQLLIIRECLTQFQGNEFVIALILFNWLILGGLGTLLARITVRRLLTPTLSRLGWLSLILAGFPTLQILAIRIFRDLLFLPGISVGFYTTLIYTFIVMAPYGLLVGFVLPYSLFVLRRQDPSYSGARVYMADNIGDVMGGALFAFVLVHWVSPFTGICLSNILLLACLLSLFPRPFHRHPAAPAGAVVVALLLAAGGVFENTTLAPVGGELAYYKESRYGRITVHKDREQFTVFEDGVPADSSHDIVAAERAIHYTLAQVDDPRSILLISARSGMLSEVAKYRPESIDYVELNPEMAHVQFRFGLIEKVPGLNVIYRDGRVHLAETGRTYDAVIVNLPEPQTFQVNRFFTDGFYNLVRRRLKPGGVLGFSVAGFDNYLAEPQRQKISSLFNTIRPHFAHVLLLPGPRIYFLCRAEPLTADIPGRLKEKSISTAYISRYYEGDVTDDRIGQIRELLDPTTPGNLDRSPRLMRIMFSQWFARFATSPTVFMGVVGVLCLVYLIRSTKPEFVLFTTGCATMGSEILVIFAFQIFFGYIYTQIGLIVTVFLAGLMPGAWFGHRLKKGAGGRRRALFATDAGLILLLFQYLLAVGKSGLPVPGWVYLLFGFAVSLICGFQFPVALSLKGDDNRAATGAFTADLVGAAFGTLAASVVLIPYVGITGTAIGLIALKALSMIMIKGITPSLQGRGL